MSQLEDKLDSSGCEVWSEEDLRGVPSRPNCANDLIAGMTAFQMNVAAVFFAVLLAGFALVGLVMSDLGEKQISISDCSRISDSVARLGCFDGLATHVSQPFKGAAPMTVVEPSPL